MENNIKIKVNKNDDLAVVAAKVFSADASEVTLVVPRLSKLAQSVENLDFLKKGLTNKKKTLSIESVDEQLITLAEALNINASNPFFQSMSKATLATAGNSDVQDGQLEQDEQVKDREGEDLGNSLIKRGPAIGDKVFAQAEKELNKTFSKKRGGYRLKMRWIMLLLLIVAGGWFMGFKVLPRAEIVVTAKKANWEESGDVVVKKGISSVNADNFEIPGQIFSQKKNVQLTFPTSNERYIKKKAVGQITIYNSFSSQPQPLVATTRFETPDGKIIRINKGVTVPGAEIADGQIIPSSITAKVTADRFGEDYNVGSISRLTIPGFKGTEKYKSFYGELKQPLTGGYSGKMADPTEEEIKMAEEKAYKTLKESLNLLLSSQMPKDFKVPEEAFSFKMINSEVNTPAGQKGEFSLSAEAELSVIGFRDDDLLSLFSKKVSEDLGESYNIKSHNFDYDVEEINLEEGEIKLSVNFSAVAEKFVDINNIKDKTIGKSESELKAAVFAISELKSVKVSLWPKWINEVPKNPEKVKITVD